MYNMQATKIDMRQQKNRGAWEWDQTCSKSNQDAVRVRRSVQKLMAESIACSLILQLLSTVY